ncbi:MAG: adenylylsulfate kinase [Symbiobacteriaceae bacterium]|jgi:predicted kinase|nr:adenylylsulfate kinase [Symbiobacteriaceae bacterium]
MLYIFGGLPGTGKSTLSLRLAAERKALHLRIDTIEQALRGFGLRDLGPAGYMVAYDVALDNLRLGLEVVADSVNPLSVTRSAWRGVARAAGVPFVEIEVICSDQQEHRRRVEERPSTVPGLVLPTWAQVVGREYDAWDRDRVVIDTAGRRPEESVAELLLALGAAR